MKLVSASAKIQLTIALVEKIVSDIPEKPPFTAQKDQLGMRAKPKRDRPSKGQKKKEDDLATQKFKTVHLTTVSLVHY